MGELLFRLPFEVPGKPPSWSSSPKRSPILACPKRAPTMPRKSPALTALAVARLTSPGRYRVGGVDGLMLYVRSPEARFWVLRVQAHGKRRDIGLGSFSAVSLAQAREAARDMQEAIRNGGDPVADRRQERAAAVPVVVELPTFRKVAEQFIELQRPSWRNAKHAAQWESTLETYAYPVIGARPVAEVTSADVLQILAPIWASKPETASRLRQRLEAVLDAAKARGLRTGDNPAAWRGNLEALLPKVSKVQKVEHHAALPWREVPEAVQRIAGEPGMGALALQFAILTAARPGEVRGATWAEIDLQARVWTVPAERMKAGKAHRVPLSDAAVALLQAVPRIEDEVLVFPGAKAGKPLSDMTLTAICRRLGLACVAHGFRSSFRQWATDQRIEHELAERCLAHQVGNAVARAYDRGDALEARVPVMQAWGNLVRGVQ